MKVVELIELLQKLPDERKNQCVYSFDSDGKLWELDESYLKDEFDFYRGSIYITGNDSAKRLF